MVDLGAWFADDRRIAGDEGGLESLDGPAAETDR